MPRTCAQTAIIPRNNVIDAKAVASSTTERNMTASLPRTNKEHNSLFVLGQAIFRDLFRARQRGVPDAATRCAYTVRDVAAINWHMA
jgi:hypothetical protein